MINQSFIYRTMIINNMLYDKTSICFCFGMKIAQYWLVITFVKSLLSF